MGTLLVEIFTIGRSMLAGLGLKPGFSSETVSDSVPVA
jgi:hypothetical protein